MNEEVIHMKISEIITKIKNYHQGIVHGQPIDETKTRDKVLFGNTNQECSGIVTTCYASVDVIKKAIELGANFIICHEALFWYRGDFTDWLEEQGNKTYLEKKKLLEEHHMVVWRNHDYIHSGIPMKDGTYVDGIFHGVMKELGWENYLACDPTRPMIFEIPERSAEEIGHEWIEKFHLNGIKALGNLQTKVKKIAIMSHIMGEIDKEIIRQMDQENIDCIITMELIDYTVSEYVRDSAMLGIDKAILAIGHFNVEEPGMKYMLEYLDDAIEEHIEAHFVPSTDMYQFIHSSI